MILGLLGVAFARDIDLKVHDMKAVVTGEVSVELGEPGQTALHYVCHDDGAAPDAVAGDHLYTTHVAGLELDHGTVRVHAGDRTWEGGFRFDDSSDPVLLVGLEDGGFAAASTREVMFVPQDRMLPPGVGAPGSSPSGDGGMAGGPPGTVGGPLGGGVTGDGGRGEPGAIGGGGAMGGAAGGGAMGGAAGAGGTAGGAGAVRKAPTRSVVPAGLWLGWAVAAAAVAGLGALAWFGARRPARIPPVVGLGGAAGRITTASRGPFVPGERTDLTLGPGAGLGIGEGRWSPEEVALAALRVGVPTRVVVTDPSRLEVEGDPYDALAAALVGVADLLWVVPPS